MVDQDFSMAEFTELVEKEFNTRVEFVCKSDLVRKEELSQMYMALFNDQDAPILGQVSSLVSFLESAYLTEHDNILAAILDIRQLPDEKIQGDYQGLKILHMLVFPQRWNTDEIVNLPADHDKNCKKMLSPKSVFDYKRKEFKMTTDPLNDDFKQMSTSLFNYSNKNGPLPEDWWISINARSTFF